MSISTLTKLAQLELLFDDSGALAAVIRQDRVTVLSDGSPVGASNLRASFSADSPEAKAAFGDALAAALAATQAAQAGMAEAQAQAAGLKAQLAGYLPSEP